MITKLRLSHRDAPEKAVAVTHFMGEAERCDRVSFMHAGKVLAEGTPDALIAAEGADTLEGAFIAVLEAADPPAPVVAPEVSVDLSSPGEGGSVERRCGPQPWWAVSSLSQKCAILTSGPAVGHAFLT